MKQIAIVIAIVLITMPFASADSSWNPIEIGKDMITDGVLGALRALADEIMDLICGTPEEEGEETHDTITTMIINFASWGVKPFEYPSVIKMMGVSFAVGIGILITYIFVGGGASAISGNTADYGKNSMSSILLMAFAPLVVWVMLLFMQVVKIMLMESIANSISPSLDNCLTLYIAMALMWLFVAIFFAISNLVICVGAGLCFVLAALYASNKTRHIATWAFDYFVTMLVMQVMVIVIAVLTVGMVTDIKAGEYAWAMAGGMEQVTYAGMILLILVMCTCMVFGKALVLKTAKKALLLVI